MSTKEIATALRYGSAAHSRVRDALKARIKMSANKMDSRYRQMAVNEELFQSYIPEKEVDAIRRRKKQNEGEVDYSTIEIPHSYAVVMTSHTYYSSVFLSRNPVFQLAGRHGEPENKRAAVEAMLGYQLQVGGMLANLFCWLLDPGKYGYSVIGHHWDKEITRVRQFVDQPQTILGIPLPGLPPKKVAQLHELTGYEGNKIYNVRPQDFFPDPRVALVNFQKGEFCARYVEVSWSEIYSGQQTGRYFNYDTLRRMRDSRDTYQANDITRDEGSSRVTQLPGATEPEAGYDVPVGFVKSHEIYLKIIPSEWRLGTGSQEEIWVFNLTTNGVLFGANPLGEYHGKFPFDILLDEIDGYTIYPKSTLERCKPLNDVLTWLINSHFYNVRSAMNNQFIVDPSMVVMKDVESKDPGKIIRLKPAAYGKDVRMALTQLQTMDVTKGHIGQDLNVVIDFIARMTGTNDTVMGMINSGGRKTATEVRSSTSFGVNRLKTMCEWHSAVGFTPLVQKLVQRTQQHYSAEKQFRLVGDLAQFSQQFAMVTPDDIAGFYDYEAVDGTLPIDRFAQANLWQMLMGQMQHYPQIMMTYDIAKIFAWVAQLAGIKNLASFKITPDQALMNQVQAGNVVPLQQAMKDTGLKGNMNEPRQIPGMGATG